MRSVEFIQEYTNTNLTDTHFQSKLKSLPFFTAIPPLHPRPWTQTYLSIQSRTEVGTQNKLSAFFYCSESSNSQSTLGRASRSAPVSHPIPNPTSFLSYPNSPLSFVQLGTPEVLACLPALLTLLSAKNPSTGLKEVYSIFKIRQALPLPSPILTLLLRFPVPIGWPGSGSPVSKAWYKVQRSGCGCGEGRGGDY